jgi:hypothetical protein
MSGQEVWIVTSGDDHDENEQSLIGAYSSPGLARVAAENPDLGRGWCRTIQRVTLDASIDYEIEPIHLNLEAS